MRKNFGAKPLLNPKPVLVVGTYNDDGTPNAMVVAWGGVAGSDQVTICVSGNHRTAENIVKRGDFTVSVATANYVTEVDYLGLVSGSDVADKVARAGFHTVKSELVNAPLFEELPLSLECKMISYDSDSHLMLGQVLNVCADERILDEEGRIDMAKLQPIVYDSVKRDYFALGQKVGDAYGSGSKLK